jgi:hypothetical protein
VARLRTPCLAQAWIRGSVAYNWERRRSSIQTFRGVARRRRAHCLEAAISAATVLEQHGHPPLVLDLESADGLDHVVFAFRQRGRWGAVGQSRLPGLGGRRPVFRSVRALVESYAAPYVDATGRIVGYALVDLRDAPRPDWRLSDRDVWWLERWLVRHEHEPYRMPEAEYRRYHQRYHERRRRGRPDGRGLPLRPTWM